MATDTEKRVSLRMPEELHAAVLQLAQADTRSMHAEILVLLREAVVARSAREGQAPAKPATEPRVRHI